MPAKTILDAVVSVLEHTTDPQTPSAIHAAIVARQLYDFSAKDQLGVVRGCIRKHLRAVEQGKLRARVVRAGDDTFVIARPT